MEGRRCVGPRASGQRADSVVLPKAMERPRPGRLRGAHRFSVPLLLEDIARLSEYALRLGTTKTALARDLIRRGLETLSHE